MLVRGCLVPCPRGLPVPVRCLGEPGTAGSGSSQGPICIPLAEGRILPRPAPGSAGASSLAMRLSGSVYPGHWAPCSPWGSSALLRAGGSQGLGGAGGAEDRVGVLGKGLRVRELQPPLHSAPATPELPSHGSHHLTAGRRGRRGPGAAGPAHRGVAAPHPAGTLPPQRHLRGHRARGTGSREGGSRGGCRVWGGERGTGSGVGSTRVWAGSSRPHTNAVLLTRRRTSGTW